mgnify:CR=1 FL=1
MAGVDVHFTATNANWSQQDLETDEHGLVSVMVSPTSEQDIVVTASALDLNRQVTVTVRPERPMLWALPRLGNPGGASKVCAGLIDARHLPMTDTEISFTADSGGAFRNSQGQLVTELLAATGPDGIARVDFEQRESGNPHVTACFTNACSVERCVSISAPTQPYKVGFLFYLCMSESDVNVNVHNYLSRIDQEYDEVVYEQITDISSGVDSSFNVVFVVMPTRYLTTSELSALSAFVQSGRLKRVVLVGEYNLTDSQYRLYNLRLNSIAAEIGMDTLFSTGTGFYDDGLNRERHCSVSTLHYLTAGVSYLCDAATDTFVSGWQEHALPLAFIHSHDTWPWIIEEDTATAGSRIAIHDASMMDPYYGKSWDEIPDRNFLLICNLCSSFQE